MPSEKLQNIIYHNKQNLKFEEVGLEWGLTDFSFSNGAAQGDLDNDGDLDIVINNMDEEAFLYQNLAIENNLGNYLKVKAIGEKSESFPKIKIKYFHNNALDAIFCQINSCLLCFFNMFECTYSNSIPGTFLRYFSF